MNNEWNPANSRLVKTEHLLLVLMLIALAVLISVTHATAAPLAQAGGIRFAAFGDYGSNSTNEQAVANMVAGWNPDFIITTGDNSYGSTAIDTNIGKYYQSYIGNYAGTYGSGSLTHRFFPSLGNHDYTDGGQFTAYSNYFTLPNNERYYDFVQGPVHFFVLDSNPSGTGSAPGDGRSPTSAQGTWLQAQLAASTSPWKIVYFHHPPYSSGSTHGSEVAMQWPFEAWGATAVLSGHDHTYERILRDDNGDGTSLPYFVTGAGGMSLYSFVTPVTGSQLRYSSSYGAMLIEADSTSITFNFYSVDGGGTLRDSYTLNAPALEEIVWWTAYNDSVYSTTNSYIGSNVTTYGIGTGYTGPASGQLLNQATGLPTGITATFTQSGGVNWQPTVSGGGADTAAGTDAYQTFHGLTDMLGVIYYGSTGWYVDLTFTGLDSTKVYTFATSASRNNTAYTDRYTRFTLSGVDAAVNASTAGITLTGPYTAAFNTGDNHNQGYVARWTNIQPGADGSFSVRAQAHGTQSNAYAFSVFMLQEVGAPPSQHYNLTVNTVGSGSVTLNPAGGTYAGGTVVTLSAASGTGYGFSSWSGDLTGSTNPATITMDGNKTVTATFNTAACVPFTENFNGLTLGTRIGQVAGWTESGAASPAVVPGGLASTQGITTGSSIFNWSAHPFTWTNPALTEITFQMDFQANASGTFDDDRLAWMTENIPANSQSNFGIQLDPDTDGTACPTGQNIETYWRNPAFGSTRVETTIACLPTLTNNGWYRAQLVITKLTNTSAKLDVSLTALDASGNPGAVVASGSVTDTSTWPGGAVPAAYFSPSGTSTALYPSYKNHNGTIGNADNVVADLCSGPVAQYTLSTNVAGNGTITKNPEQAQYASGTVVQLTATPNVGYVFAGWSGDLSGSANPTTLTMNDDKVVTATFTLPPPAQPLPIQVGDQWRYLKGQSAPPANWAATGFDDSAWALGLTGIGYADSDDATVLSDMLNNYVSVYARKAFSVTNPAALTGLILQIDYDDGFVAYLNGTEVTRRGLTGSPPAYNALATSHEASGGDSSPQPVEYINISTAPLVAGVNVLAFQVHNTTLASTDLSFIPALYEPQQFTLTVNTVGSGSVALNPAGGVYAQGTVVTLTATPGANYVLSGWSGGLSGSANPMTITMNANKSVTATFVVPPPVVGICEGFETGYTLGQTIGTHADWFDAGAGPVVNAGVGVTGSRGLAAATDIFTWLAHPFNWNDADLAVANFQMDFKTDASGDFDDDRIGWMITDTSAVSSDFFGVQLDHPDGGIVTYWRDSTDARIQTPIVPLTRTTATKADTWYRFQAKIAKLTATSAKIDVALTELDATGVPAGAPITGSVADTSLWPGGAPATRYFTASTMWPAYKNHTTAASNADNACFSQVERFAFVVTTDWHTSDSWPNAIIADNLQQIREWIVTPTLAMPSPAFMVVTGDFPNWDQTQASIDNVLGSGFLWYPVIGNHDVADNINNFNYIRDTMVPALANIVDYGPAGSVNTSYSWNYGNAHFVSLNAYWDGTSNPNADHLADGNIVPALNTWINADLTTNGQAHDFAFVHEPAYPAHRHVGDSLDLYPANRDAFISTLNAHNVETLFTGHTHYYEHDVAPEYPLGNLHQITNGYLREYNAEDGSTITYVLVNGDCTTYQVYKRTSPAPFVLHETWSRGCGASAQYTLTTNVAGNGTITKNPEQAQYASGTVVQLTATPNVGYVFAGWSGDLSGSANPTTLTMNDDKVVTATFTLPPPAQPLPIQVGDQWRYLKGQSAPPVNWAATGFDDSAWALGPTGIGYADSDDATVLSDMLNNYVSVYARKAFSVTSPAALTGLILQIDYDDGFVAYLNGTEVARRGLTGTPPAYNALATSHEASGGDSSPQPVEYINISTAPLVAGVNVLAFQVHNTTLASTDLSFIPALYEPQQFTLTVNTIGSGSVALNPAGGVYAQGTVVTLTATPGANYVLSGWSGDLSGSANPATLTMNANKSVTATFIPGTADLIAYWRLDESSGTTAADSSGNSNTGTLVNGGTWITGKVRNGLRFDGTNDHVVVNNSASINSITNRITIAFWANVADLSNEWVTALQRRNAADWFDWQLYLRASDAPTANHPVFRVDWNSSGTNDAGEQVECSTILATGQWYFIAITYDGSQMRFYLNGTSCGTTAKSGGAIPNSARQIWLGGNEPWGEYLNGMLDEVRIYRRALSQAEIQSLMTPTLNVGTVGSGTVTKTPNQAQYAAGTVVTLTATPNSGYVFSGWLGDLSGPVNPATITMDSNRVVTATFLAVVTNTLSAGWNLLALPLQPDTSLNAQSLLNSLNVQSQPGNCTEVDRWIGNAWDSYNTDLGGINFQIVPGQGYFVSCTTALNWQMQGHTFQASVPLNLLTGWNLMAVPYPTTFRSPSLLSAIGSSCVEIDRWFGNAWYSYNVDLGGTNFAILPQEGYFLQCNSPSTFTP